VKAQFGDSNQSIDGTFSFTNPDLRITETGTNGINFTPDMSLDSGRIIGWSSNTTYYGTKDIGLKRASAGVLEINNGTAGTLRDLSVRNITATSVKGIFSRTFAFMG